VPCGRFAPRGKLMRLVSNIYTLGFRTFAHTSCTDKEYRKAVHWLETLRLRRTKILEGGYKVSNSHFYWTHPLHASCQSLETFIGESAATVKKALEKYTDNMTCVHPVYCLVIYPVHCKLVQLRQRKPSYLLILEKLLTRSRRRRTFPGFRRRSHVPWLPRSRNQYCIIIIA
jgi:hypothetical protein